MDQNEKNDSGPWYNPENLNSNAEHSENEKKYETQNQCGQTKSDKSDLLSQTEDNALVFGAISMVLGIFSLVGEKLVLGIIGLIFGKISNGKKQNTYAKIGIICSIISIAIGVISLLVLLVIFVIYGTACFEILKSAVQINV